MYTPLKYAEKKNEISKLCRELESSLSRLTLALEKSVAWSWSSTDGFVEDQISADVVAALVNCEYQEHGKEPPIQSVICCPDSVEVDLACVNTAKQQLKECFVSFDNIRVDVDSERRPLALAILRDLGRSDMDRLLAYRHIYCFTQLPEIVGFSRSNVRTVARKSIVQVLAWLSKMSQENSESYRNTVMALPHDQPLALVKGRYSSQRANIKINGVRKMIPAHLPLIITGTSSAVPVIKAAREKQPSTTGKVRGDKKLRDKPLFEVGAIAVYQYREEYLAAQTSDEAKSDDRK